MLGTWKWTVAIRSVKTPYLEWWSVEDWDWLKAASSRHAWDRDGLGKRKKKLPLNPSYTQFFHNWSIFIYDAPPIAHRVETPFTPHRWQCWESLCFLDRCLMASIPMEIREKFKGSLDDRDVIFFWTQMKVSGPFRLVDACFILVRCFDSLYLYHGISQN